MKKLILSVVLLITTLMPFAALSRQSYNSCNINAPRQEFCQCFYRGCTSVFNPGQCLYSKLVSYFKKVGIANACKANARDTNKQECIDGINHYIEFCGLQ